METRVVVTGGAGFIGSHFVRHLIHHYPDYRVVVLDNLSYAGNLDNLADLQGHPRFTFVHGDIRDRQTVERTLRDACYVVHFAAETHVDRSILDPESFITTDVYGTYLLLETARRFGVERFVHISTDEVYGPVEAGRAREEDPFRPSSPYAASKAGADLLAGAYFKTYRLPVLITRGCNTFGPNQYPEKLIPFFVIRALEDEPLPLYGDGQQVRDWLYVLDHVRAIDLVLHRGVPGEAYNIGAGNERTNLEVTRAILRLLGKPESLIRFVRDRPAHDRRYALDSSKIRALGWKPEHPFEQALEATVRWYVQNRAWWERIKKEQRAYREFVARWYGER